MHAVEVLDKTNASVHTLLPPRILIIGDAAATSNAWCAKAGVGGVMAFEAAFGVTAALSAIFALLYARSRKAQDNIMRSNIRLEEQLKAAEERVRYMPTAVKALSADLIKE